MKNGYPETSKEVSQWLKWFYNSPDIHEPQHNNQCRDLHSVVSVCAFGEVLKITMVKRPPRQKNATEGKYKRIKKTTEGENAERFTQSLSRARSRVYELAMCNEFRFFGTFTQDENLRDRFELSDFRKDFAQYVRNLNRHRPEGLKIKYLMIPEQHKNGAWHMHGLLQGLTTEDLRAFKISEKIPERIKKQIRNGTAVYDWTGYRSRFGYFTATEIKDKIAVSKYITKYLTKDMSGAARKAGEHLFFASQGLNGKTLLHKETGLRLPITWDFENQYVAVKELPLDEVTPEFITALNAAAF